MDNDIEFGNIDVKYYLSRVSETPLWNSGDMEFRGQLTQLLTILRIG